MASWLSWLERRPVTAEVEGSSPSGVVYFHIWKYRFQIIFIATSKLHTALKNYLSTYLFLRINLRSISIHQLNVLPHLHLEPIYLIVFKGSYLLDGGDISS